MSEHPEKGQTGQGHIQDRVRDSVPFDDFCDNRFADSR